MQPIYTKMSYFQMLSQPTKQNPFCGPVLELKRAVDYILLAITLAQYQWHFLFKYEEEENQYIYWIQEKHFWTKWSRSTHSSGFS